MPCSQRLRMGSTGGAAVRDSVAVPFEWASGPAPRRSRPRVIGKFLMSDLGRVLVLAGGLSHERDVSLRSGRRVADALRSVGVEVEQRDVDASLVDRLRNDPPDAVFPVLHGVTGEDGALRQVLDLYGVPYVGADAAACRTAFDKPVARDHGRRGGTAHAAVGGARPRHVPRAGCRRADGGGGPADRSAAGREAGPWRLGAGCVDRAVGRRAAVGDGELLRVRSGRVDRAVHRRDRGGRDGRRHRRRAACAACRGDPAGLGVLRLRGALHGGGDAVRRTGAAGGLRSPRRAPRRRSRRTRRSGCATCPGRTSWWTRMACRGSSR